MANVQPENGFTKIANEILEAIQMFKFTTNQFKIIMSVWRSTYGWHKKEGEMSLSYIQKATNLSRSRVNENLKELIRCKVITVVKKGGSNQKGKMLAFNKNYDEWTILKYASSSVQGGTSLQNGTSVRNSTTASVQDGTTSSVQNSTSTSVRNDTQKRKDKENYKEKSKESIPYAEIINYLNEKADKRFSVKSEANKKLISGRFSEGRTIEDFKHVIDVKVEQWLNNQDMNDYLRPATLFSQKNFENYVNEKRKAKKENPVDSRDKDIEFQQWCQEGKDPELFNWSR